MTFEGRTEGEEGKEALTYPEKSIPIPICENGQHVSQGPSKVLRNYKKLVWLEQSEWGECRRGEAGRQHKGGPSREMGNQRRNHVEERPLLFLASFQPFTHLLKISACFVTLAGTWKK